jgi:hypothetical protein
VEPLLQHWAKKNVHYQYIPGDMMKGKGTVTLEPGFSDNAIGGLLRRGHIINRSYGGYG